MYLKEVSMYKCVYFASKYFLVLNNCSYFSVIITRHISLPDNDLFSIISTGIKDNNV